MSCSQDEGDLMSTLSSDCSKDAFCLQAVSKFTIKQNILCSRECEYRGGSEKVSEILTHPADPTGRSKLNSVTWWLKSGDLVSLDCYDWHKDMPYDNNLKVVLDTKEFNDWLVKGQQ